jgi:glycine cleavage system H protein
MSVPGDLQYTKSHEWVRTEGDTATIGITDHAQDELGDVVFVELPDEGTTLDAGESFGTVESVRPSRTYTPRSAARSSRSTRPSTTRRRRSTRTLTGKAGS